MQTDGSFSSQQSAFAVPVNVLMHAAGFLLLLAQQSALHEVRHHWSGPEAHQKTAADDKMDVTRNEKKSRFRLL